MGFADSFKKVIGFESQRSVLQENGLAFHVLLPHVFHGGFKTIRLAVLRGDFGIVGRGVGGSLV